MQSYMEQYYEDREVYGKLLLDPSAIIQIVYGNTLFEQKLIQYFISIHLCCDSYSFTNFEIDITLVWHRIDQIEKDTNQPDNN